MPKRDWSKDWEMCEKATISPEDPNGQFIAEAREALPYWLRRVRELETQLAEVQEALREIVNSPAILDDERLDYVEMQVCRAALEDAQKLLRGDRDAAGLD